MTIFFCFSDESGNLVFKVPKNDSYNRYYIRASIIMDANEWKLYRENYYYIKDFYEIPTNEEIKWSYLWSIKNYQEKPDPKKPPKKIPAPLLFIPYENLISFVDSSLDFLTELSYCTIILTISDNYLAPQKDLKKNLIRHLEYLMERIEMEFQYDPNNLCILHFDELDNHQSNTLVNAYNNIRENGIFIEKFSNILDCLHFEKSHHSVGIQLADMIAGISLAFFKGYPEGSQIFISRVLPFIRRGYYSEEIFGYGIVEIPGGIPKVRENFKNMLWDYI